LPLLFRCFHAAAVSNDASLGTVGGQDKKLLKPIWDIQKNLPAIHIFGTIIVTPNDFILMKAPHLRALLDKKVRLRQACARAFEPP
jgi:hypothetical protein